MPMNPTKNENLIKYDTPNGEEPKSRSVSPLFEELTTEDLAYVDNVPSLWMSENAKFLIYPGFRERAAMLTVDGEIITADPDTGFNSRSSTPELNTDHADETSTPSTIKNTTRGSNSDTTGCDHAEHEHIQLKLEAEFMNALIKELQKQPQQPTESTSSSCGQTAQLGLTKNRPETDMSIELATISRYTFPPSTPAQGASSTYGLHK